MGVLCFLLPWTLLYVSLSPEPHMPKAESEATFMTGKVPYGLLSPLACLSFNGCCRREW